MKLKRTQKGAALVEFAIVAILLFTLIFGMISFGFMLYDQVVITNASRVGARAGVVFGISGIGYGNYPTCSPLASNTNPSYIPTTADAQTTAQCNALAAINSSVLITFGSANTPVISATSTGTCGSPPSNTCLLTVTVSYSFIGIYQFQNVTALTANTAMYYE